MQERQQITARRSELDAFAEKLGKQLQEAGRAARTGDRGAEC